MENRTVRVTLTYEAEVPDGLQLDLIHEWTDYRANGLWPLSCYDSDLGDFQYDLRLQLRQVQTSIGAETRITPHTGEHPHPGYAKLREQFL